MIEPFSAYTRIPLRSSGTARQADARRPSAIARPLRGASLHRVERFPTDAALRPIFSRVAGSSSQRASLPASRGQHVHPACRLTRDVRTNGPDAQALPCLRHDGFIAIACPATLPGSLSC